MEENDEFQEVEDLTPQMPLIEIQLWSRWVDGDGKLFIVVEKINPQVYNPKKIPQQKLRVLEVNRECTWIVPRTEFEESVNQKKLTRKLD